MQDARHIATLIRKHLRQELPETGRAELDAWLEGDPGRRAYLDALTEGDGLLDDLALYDRLWGEGTGEARLARIERYIRAGGQFEAPPANAQVTKKVRWRARVARALPYAAAIILVASVVGWWAVSHQPSAVDIAATEILPGTNRATLTLADGRTIDLSEEQEGIIIQDGITYLDGSRVMENEELRMEHERPTLHSITTPKGGTYQIALPDGSKVWLNAASTLKYPSRFSGETREVILEGEAFFDIVELQGIPKAFGTPASNVKSSAGGVKSSVGARVSRVPFNVQTANQVVDVLGTQFNISAYSDDPETKTTLVEGKVRVVGQAEAHNHTPNESGVTLSPGQQSTTRGSSITVTTVDTEYYTSWKDGYFSLKGTIPEVLRQVARWYDVEVVFEGGMGRYTEVLDVQIPRDVMLADVLAALELADPAFAYGLTAIANKNDHKKPERRLTVSR